MTSPEPRLTRSEALHLQVARKLRNDIAAGVLRDGETLPSTRELAKQWDVSVFTITEAMRVLADEGLVVSKSRSKRVVHAPDQGRRNEIRLPQPQVIFVGGYAGSGKTELGRILAKETGWPMLDKDTLTRPVVEAALEILGLSPHDRESERYLTLIRPREYESLMAAALENVGCGNSAIVTAPFIREFSDATWITRTRAMLTGLKAATTLVWVYCDADSMNGYIRQRGAARDGAKLADWPGYVASINLDFRPPAPHVVVNNCTSGEPLQSQAAALLKAVLGGEQP
ncbi:AAA domain-containing protein [Micromonospora haikouensis]|uniref:AAA domain-containing protein n=1 Tax=Micromonospora haikouensis TaxID=686309 RepID=A0A1C4UIZ2_9ACTN|nr:AAA domain-containing protein [Micromonospora haikouensis]